MCKNIYNLSVNVEIDVNDVHINFRKAIKEAENEYLEKEYDYHHIYIKHFLGLKPDTNTHFIMIKLQHYKKMVQYKLYVTCSMEKQMVENLLFKNKYICKKISPLGATVKLFRTMYNKDDAIVKTYVFDPECLSLKYNVTRSFEDEVLFQYYANDVCRKIDFICPEIYSWGKINKFKFENDDYNYCCLFIIMKYIPGVTLAETSYNKDTMKKIYEKINISNREMIAAGIHHNDLHANNIIVSDKSPLPEIIILDFGEASIGPKRPLFKD